MVLVFLFLIGWLWSIAWGIMFVVQSGEYR
jgi:hypothetical protein